MNEKIDWAHIETKELAGLICQHFKNDGIEAVLVGGSCVTIYSNNRYVSQDLDYISYQDYKEIKISLEKIDFFERGNHFEHAECPFLIDFVKEPVAIGKEIIKNFEEMLTRYGTFKLLKADDCVRDRLASFYYWDDRQGLEQAINVCLDRKIDMEGIQKWSKREGFEKKFLIFVDELTKHLVLRD